MRHVLTVALLVGCSAAGSDIDQQVEVIFDRPQVEFAYSAAPVECGMQVTPDPSIEEAVRVAGARWHAATGCPVDIVADGIPIHAQPYVFYDVSTQEVSDVNPQLKLKQVCGLTMTKFRGTTPFTSAIYIGTEDSRCDSDTTLLHELGHVWGPPSRHADDGVMADGKSPLQTNVITENSLSFVCERMQCQTFSPEL